MLLCTRRKTDQTCGTTNGSVSSKNCTDIPATVFSFSFNKTFANCKIADTALKNPALQLIVEKNINHYKV